METILTESLKQNNNKDRHIQTLSKTQDHEETNITFNEGTIEIPLNLSAKTSEVMCNERVNIDKRTEGNDVIFKHHEVFIKEELAEPDSPEGVTVKAEMMTPEVEIHVKQENLSEDEDYGDNDEGIFPDSAPSDHFKKLPSHLQWPYTHNTFPLTDKNMPYPELQYSLEVARQIVKQNRLKLPTKKVIKKPVKPPKPTTKTKDKFFECDTCSKKFTIRGNLVKHMRIHTGERPFKCETCQRMFIQRSHLENHIRTHTNERPFICHICERAFAQSSSLRSHISTHDGNKQYKCETCDKMFTERRHLNRHILIHSAEKQVKPFKCNLCPRTFTLGTRLKNHMLTHVCDMYECNICHSRFPIQEDLKKHICDDKTHMCEICHKCFTDKKNLYRHIRAHNGEKSFKCTHCDRSFSQRGNLDRHIRTHTGEKPYRCDLCCSRFSQQSHLEGHIRIHTGERPYKCDFCHKTFIDRSALKSHFRSHTGLQPHKCGVCQKMFSKPEGLNNHMRKEHAELVKNEVDIEIGIEEVPTNDAIDLSTSIVIEVPPK